MFPSVLLPVSYNKRGGEAVTILQMESSAKNMRIVLVRPRNPLNIAAAARAARNFGFDDLVVVAPYAPVWEEAKTRKGAAQWMRRARAVPRLLDAIEDCDCVLGTSCLARRRPPETQPVLSLDTLSSCFRSSRIPKSQFLIPTIRDRVAILFGSEKRGLTNEDLGYCHAIIRIPTIERAASMNLGQAVAVCCYELRHLRAAIRHVRAMKAATASRAPLSQIIRLTDALEKLLLEVGVSEEGRARKRAGRTRQMLLRWGLTGQDATFLLGLVRDLSWQIRHKT